MRVCVCVCVSSLLIETESLRTKGDSVVSLLSSWTSLLALQQSWPGKPCACACACAYACACVYGSVSQCVSVHAFEFLSC
jgi:hypothetical protein